ncbi:hypothetical protein [Geminocystis sp. NIES-3709]|uniref:hypothetical protein n=1 Tax=Geminocystis sp. NIES-3709 TaxID=1617448 RepID=UPI0005FCA0B8|nr:hypothetical protein [Geminocystis sp. NIES-3709]BAQ63872.1 hypothetical protein GM3709_637 [Geminocystis sp. NIES-3709]
MTNSTQNKNNTDNESRSWYSRPLWGNQSFMTWFQSILNGIFSRKLEIPESTIAIYKDSFNSLKNISALARTVDNDKFNSREFISFLTLNRQFESNTGTYEGLKYSIELLRVALETKESFLKIEATETRYRSYSQQEFYEYVYEYLQRDLTVSEFQELIQRQLTDIIPKIKTDEGKAAIQSYVNQLDIVCKDKLGLKLLYLFKQYDMSNFALLRNVAEIADTFYDKDLDTLKEFMVVVQLNAELFLKLGQIIQVPVGKNKPETYASMLQYIALRNRHQKSYGQFQQLLGLLKEWQKYYNPLITIRQQYSPKEYKQPVIFSDEIPGLAIYNKYCSNLET